MSSEIDFNKIKSRKTMVVNASRTRRSKSGALFFLDAEVEINMNNKQTRVVCYVHEVIGDTVVLRTIKERRTRSNEEKLSLIRLILDNKL